VEAGRVAEHDITRDGLRALASMAGLELTEDRIEALLPEMRKAAESRAQLDRLDLSNVEPAVVFTPAVE
jgi:Asp-tRNA(Asn)/Glu-tRNA(Gln) amidotransferase C subunit